MKHNISLQINNASSKVEAIEAATNYINTLTIFDKIEESEKHCPSQIKHCLELIEQKLNNKPKRIDKVVFENMTKHIYETLLDTFNYIDDKYNFGD